MKREEIIRDIIGAAMTLLNELKPGLSYLKERIDRGLLG
jgi:hypothetical protein